MNRVYCLYRVSDRGQVEKNDIPMQRIACRTFAQERGWEIEKELSEKGISGYKLTMQQRDAILEIREAALAGKFDILLVYMFDRIGRRDDETPFVVEWLTRNGIAVWSVCEGEQRFDNHTAERTVPFISRTAGSIAAMPAWMAFQWNVMGRGPIGPNESRKRLK